MSVLSRRKSCEARSKPAQIELLEDRRLLSAVGHPAGLKLQPVANLTVVQGESENMAIATVSGPGTAAIASGVTYGDQPVGIQAEVHWGSGKSAASQKWPFAQQAVFGSTAQADVYDIIAINPLSPGVHPFRVTLTNNGKTIGTVKETIRVQKTTPNGVQLHAKVGQPLTATLGYIQSAPPAGQELEIDWEDSLRNGSSPQVELTPNGSYAVSATHTFDKPGKYVIIVSDISTGGVVITDYIPNEIVSMVTVTRR